MRQEPPPTSPGYGPATEDTPQGYEAAPAFLVLGEALIDIVDDADGNHTEHVGGSPANVALGLARLSNPVELTTHIGPDARGAQIRQALETDAVDFTAGSTRAERTSTARAVLGEDGSASYTFDLAWDIPDHVPLRAPSHVHVGSIGATLEPGASKVAEVVARRQEEATISYDPNTRPHIMAAAEQTRPVVEALVARADVVKASEEDLVWLAPGTEPERLAGQWLELGAALVVVTRGDQGAWAWAAQGGQVEVPARQVSVVDTVGAGDAFMAGLLDGLRRAGLIGARHRQALREASSDTLRAMLERAGDVAALTVARAGANPPTAAELSAGL